MGLFKRIKLLHILNEWKNEGLLFLDGHYLAALRSTNWEHFKSNPPARAMKLLIIKSLNVPRVSNRYPFMKNPTINPSP
jgi:hypothetical protein